MIEFVNEPVDVEVRLRQDETPLPMAFVWRGRRFKIVSWGRESNETQEGSTVHCHLVQTAEFETWELCQDVEKAQWTLMRHWARKQQIV